MSYLNDSTNKINDIFVFFCLQYKLVDAVAAACGYNSSFAPCVHSRSRMDASFVLNEARFFSECEKEKYPTKSSVECRSKRVM